MGELIEPASFQESIFMGSVKTVMGVQKRESWCDEILKTTQNELESHSKRMRRNFCFSSGKMGELERIFRQERFF